MFGLSLAKENEFVNRFQKMMTHEDEIKAHYAKMMPEFIERVYMVTDLFI